MTPQEVDRILAQSAERSLHRDLESTVARVKSALPFSIAPVRPMPSPLVLGILCLAIFGAVASAGAVAFGMYGLPVLSPMARAVIFPLLITSACIAAVAVIRECRPAGGTRMVGAALLFGTFALLSAFAALFQDYAMPRFFPEGVKCLAAGLVCAIPAGVLILLLLRRGLVLDWRAAGMAGGTLAGLAGIGMLELHCPILQAPHIMFWHVAVVWISGMTGWLIGVLARR